MIYAAGRVGTPTVIMKSTDGGNNWVGTDLSNQCRMILDIHFQTEQIGYVFAGTSNNINNSKARILRTEDGGATWNTVFTSTRTYEIFWKASFPTADVGFATIQSYNTTTTQRYIVKTTDGGLTWIELPLANSGVREFGIGFIDENVGWVGGENSGYETLDGGLTWTSKNIGQYANKMSIVSNTDGSKTCYAVGLNVYKMETSNLATTTVVQKKSNALIYPNPAKSGGLVAIALDGIKSKITKAELIGIDGKSTEILFNDYFEGTRESPFMFYLPSVAAGEYIVKFSDEKNGVHHQKVIIKN